MVPRATERSHLTRNYLSAAQWKRAASRDSVGTLSAVRQSKQGAGSRETKLSLPLGAELLPCSSRAPQGPAEIVQVQSQTLEGEELLFVVFQRQRFEVDAAAQKVTELDCQVNAAG